MKASIVYNTRNEPRILLLPEDDRERRILDQEHELRKMVVSYTDEVLRAVSYSIDTEEETT